MSLFCPSCAKEVTKDDTQCPSCGFSYKILNRFYKDEGKKVHKLVSDRKGVLSDEERTKLKQAINAFISRFQSVYVAFVFDELEEAFDADSKGLWLLNHTEFVDLPNEVKSENGILVFIDIKKTNASISYCDSLSEYFTKKETYSILGKAYLSLKKTEYFKATSVIMEELQSHLSKRCS